MLGSLMYASDAGQLQNSYDFSSFFTAGLGIAAAIMVAQLELEAETRPAIVV